MKKQISILVTIITTSLLFPTQAHAESLRNSFLKGEKINAISPNFGGPLTTFLQPVVNNLPIVTGLISFFYILVAGFRYIIGAGNSDETAKAANTITYALIGLALSILAYWFTSILFQAGGAPQDLFQ